MSEVATNPQEKKDLRAASPREMSSQERAALRAKEILDQGSDLFDESNDNFYVNPECIPDGWTYEWKTATVFNKEETAYQLSLARRGWTAVPAERHPEMMPIGYTGKDIIRDGQRLMERPKEITDEIRAIELRTARSQVKMKEDQLNAAPPGQFDRSNKDASLVKVKKGFDAIRIPE